MGYFRLIDVMNNYSIPMAKVSRSKEPLYNSKNISGLEIYVLGKGNSFIS